MVLQLHPALNLLHHGPICQGVQVLEHRTAVQWVLLLGTVQEQGTADAAPHYGDGPIRELPARSGPTHIQPGCLTPARPIANIFVLTDNIGGRGRGRRREGRRGRTQDPAGQRRRR